MPGMSMPPRKPSVVPFSAGIVPSRTRPAASMPARGERDDWGDKPLTEARAQWNESADLRAEFFDNFAVFQAYFDAEADGKFKIQSGRTLRG